MLVYFVCRRIIKHPLLTLLNASFSSEFFGFPLL